MQQNQKGVGKDTRVGRHDASTVQTSAHAMARCLHALQQSLRDDQASLASIFVEQALMKTFDEWRRSEEQVDDVLVIGVRV